MSFSFKFSDNKIFGENFISGRKHIHCSIGFLILHKILTQKGTIVPDKINSINKSYIWQYIYYLRMHNKRHPFFKEHVGLGAVTPKRWYTMIVQVLGVEKSKRVNTVTKNDLYNFIFKLFNSENKVYVPFLESIKHANELVNDFNSLSGQRDEIKIKPNVKIVANSNSNANGPNIKISIAADLDNIPVNNSNINSQAKVQQTQVKNIQSNSNSYLMQNQLNTQVQQVKQPNGQVRQQPNGQVRQQHNGQVRQQPNGQVRQQHNGQVRQQPNGQVRQQPNGQVRQHPNGQVRQQLNGQVRQQPNEQVRQQPNGQVKQSIGLVKLPDIPIKPV